MSDLPLSRRRAETQARLLDAAMSAFADRGVLAATVEEICDRAGFTRGAFYSNFASKDELVLALFKRDAETSSQTLLNMTADEVRATLNGTREEMLASALETFMSVQHTHRDWVIGLAEIRLYALREPAVRDAYRQYRDASRLEMISALETVKDAYGLELTMPIEHAVEFIDGIYEACMLRALTLPEAAAITDLKQLRHRSLQQVMAPLLAFLEMWIVGFKEFEGGAPEA